jgi:hypothetical protein
MRVIFRGEEKRFQVLMEREASLIHREALDHVDEVEGDGESVSDEALLEELIRQEEEEILALLAAREEMGEDMIEDEDIVMSDIGIAERR